MTYNMNMVVQYSKKQQNEIMDMLHVLCYTLQKKNQTAAFFLCILLNNESSNWKLYTIHDLEDKHVMQISTKQQIEIMDILHVIWYAFAKKNHLSNLPLPPPHTKNHGPQMTNMCSTWFNAIILDIF
jgi:hypothetical protein